MKLNTGLYLMISCVLGSAQRNLKLWKPTNSVTIRQSGGGFCANHVAGDFVEHAEDCHMFYLCVENGDAVLASCPPTMLFNSESRLCDAAGNVKCRNGTDTSMENTSPEGGDGDLNNMVTDAATYCSTLMEQQSSERIVYVGSSSSCSKYYICYYGQAILQECSSQLHWNAVTGKCDVPDRAQCTLGGRDDDLPSGGSSSFQPGGSISSDLIHCPPYGQHLYPHMQRCEFFIYCVKGHASLQQCPFYYFFDIATKSCQWSRTALCVRDLNLAPLIK
ncbi:probable chitinase 10 [Drosophila rhopaloa]|uniref:Chitin-binding type-2 domain-containing protein n=1 Tax=Drosophila rhopaloa TaxID=1041015 RepID=A0ABM5GW94_DRORH|nr:probable chitinase 10 [Drosophila rhopaloa]